jgi:hypothetical protein
MRNEIIELRLSLIFAASFTCFHFILIKFYFFSMVLSNKLQNLLYHLILKKISFLMMPH